MFDFSRNGGDTDGAARHRPEHEVTGGEQTAADCRWTALTLLCLAQFMLIVDITAVNLALPSMAQDLDLGRQSLTWVPAAYTLCFGGLLLLGGRLADGLGRRRAFLIGLAAFTGASLMSGAAHTGSELIAGRAAQGVAAALLSPAALSIVTTTFHGPERTKALGVWGAIGGAGAAVGVLVGGALTSGPGWRWVFFVNLPIGLAVLALLPRLVPASAPARSLRGLDVPGALTATATAALLVYGLIHAGSSGWGTAATMLPLAGAVLAAVRLVLVERSTAHPLLRRDSYADRAVVAGTAVMFAATILLITGFFLLSWYLQHRAGYSALKTGVVYLPVAVTTGLGAHLASHSVGHLGFRPTAVSGFVIAAVGALLLTRLPASGARTRGARGAARVLAAQRGRRHGAGDGHDRRAARGRPHRGRADLGPGQHRARTRVGARRGAGLGPGRREPRGEGDRRRRVPHRVRGRGRHRGGGGVAALGAAARRTSGPGGPAGLRALRRVRRARRAVAAHTLGFDHGRQDRQAPALR